MLVDEPFNILVATVRRQAPHANNRLHCFIKIKRESCLIMVGALDLGGLKSFRAFELIF